MHRLTATIHGWLLLLPAMALLALFTHWPALATFIDSFYSTPRPRRASRLHRARQLPARSSTTRCSGRRSRTTCGSRSAPSRSRSALAMLMALWVNDRIAGRTLVRMAYFTPTVLPMIAVANIWLFFYTPQYGLLAQVLARSALPSHNWLGSQGHGARLRHHRGDLEGSRLLHDLLPGGAAADPAEPRRGRGARGRLALVLSSAACSFRC